MLWRRDARTGIVRALLACAILPDMSDQEDDDDQAVAQKRDAILRRLLTTPPQSHADFKEQVRRAEGKVTRTRVKRASAGRRGGAVSPS